MKVESAVSELATEYGDQVEFVVIPADETARRSDEIELYGFTDLKHGLVGFAADRDVVVTIPGHDYGRPEILEAVEAVLADD